MNKFDIYENISSWIHLMVSEANKDGVTIGISGGIDSAVCGALAKSALGPNKVHGLILPYYHDHHFEDALSVANSFNIQYSVIWINQIYDSIYDTGLLYRDLTKENTMARIRMTLLRAHTNEHNTLLIGTGNQSEYMIGYCTKGGDDEADIFPIIDLLKCQVYELAGYINNLYSFNINIPQEVIDKKPSAGLSPDQTDEDDLGMTYDILDKLIIQYKWDIPAQGVTEEQRKRFSELYKNSEHKRCGIQCPNIPSFKLKP